MIRRGLMLRPLRTVCLVWSAALALALPAAAEMPTGTARLLAERQGAVRLEVACDGLAETDVAVMKVGKPLGGAVRGTILLFKGGSGTKFWTKFGKSSRRAVKALRKSGYRTVQVRWRNGWLVGAPRALEGQAALACRPATAARWVYDELHQKGPDQAFCATGNSGGSAQVAYMLTHYGLDELLSAAVLTSGPPMGRIDQGCLRRGDRGLWYSESAAGLIDQGFGFRPRTGPCSKRVAAFRDELRAASVAAGRNDYVYPKTMVTFLFGDGDGSSAVAQGLAYRDRLAKAGSPLVETLLVADSPHALPSTANGAETVVEVLESECRPRD